MNTPLQIKCPTCKQTVEWSEQSKFKPFCSARCKLIDLGEWATETHKIPGEEVFLDHDDKILK